MATNSQYEQLNEIYDGAAYLVVKDGLDIIEALQKSIDMWLKSNGKNNA